MRGFMIEQVIFIVGIILPTLYCSKGLEEKERKTIFFMGILSSFFIGITEMRILFIMVYEISIIIYLCMKDLNFNEVLLVLNGNLILLIITILIFKDRLNEPLLIGIVITNIVLQINLWKVKKFRGENLSILFAGLIIMYFSKVNQVNMIIGILGIMAIRYLLINVKIQKEIEEKNQTLEATNNCMMMLEEANMDMRKFKHDYVNILLIMNEYIKESKEQELRDFFEMNILKTKDDFIKDDINLNGLNRVKLYNLKGIIRGKIVKAQNLGLNIIIENSFKDEGMYLYEMLVEGKSTKGNGRGIGLTIVNEILSKYNDVVLDTKIENGMFIQHIIID
ncbi:MAG: GHKL domain-containing protein [Clostridium sp.]|uniref:GHKL domain-containing protein n=1 Tax=Clostridium sp. TaxID=1506 RepID=UPI003EE4B4FF